MKLHEELKKLRISQDMSCKQLADKIEVNPTYLANVESGLKAYNPIMLNKVLFGLGMPTLEYGFRYSYSAIGSSAINFEVLKPLLQDYVKEIHKESNEAIRKLTSSALEKSAGNGNQSLTDCSGEGNFKTTKE